MKKLLIFLFLTFNLFFAYSQKNIDYYKIFIDNINNQFIINKNYDDKNISVEFLENYYDKFKIFEKSKNINIQKTLQFIENKDIKSAINILKNNDLNFETGILLSRLYIFDLQLIEAEIIYEKTINLDTNNIENRIEQADFYFFRKMYLNSIELNKKILNSEIDSQIYSKIIYNISNSYFYYGDFKNALLYSSKILENNDLDNYYYLKYYNLRGLIYTNLNNFEEAEKNYNIAISKYKKLYKNKSNLNFKYLLAELYYNLAELKSKIAEYQISNSYFLESIEICNKQTNKKFNLLEAKSLYNLSLNYIQSDNYFEAIVYFDKTKSVYESFINIDTLEYLPYVAELQSKIGMIYTDLENYDKAVELFKLAETNFHKVAINKEFIAKIGFANLFNYYGILNIKMLDYNLAYEYFTKSFYLFSELDQYATFEFKDEIALVYNNLAYFYELQNDYEKAFDNYNKAVNLRELLIKINPKLYSKQLAITLNNIGNLYTISNENKSALYFLKKALNYYDSISINSNEINEISNNYNNIGVLYNKTLMYDSAIFYFKKSINLSLRIANLSPTYNYQLAKNQYNISLAYLNKNNFENSFIFINDAIVNLKTLISDETNNYLIDLSNCYNLLGDIYLYSDNYNLDSSLFNYNLAYEIILKLNLKYPDLYKDNLIETLQNLSNVYKYKRNFEKSIFYTLALLENFTNLNSKYTNQYLDKIADTKSNLSILYGEIKEKENALENAKSSLVIYRALAIKNHEKYDADVAMAYNHLGNLFSEYSNYEEAIVNYKKAIELRIILAEKKDISIIKVADTENNLALLYFEQKQYENSIQTFNDAIYIYKTIAKKSNIIDNQLKLSMALINKTIIYKELLIIDSNTEIIKIALESINEALEILNQFPDNDQSRTYMEFAVQLKGFFNTYNFQNNY